ncbi:MAG: hypothetical protein HC790_13425 [Acaryochloridaceae cyanobacterium CSU_3_4]|nr:hypothetical protein [Acaryochloridaceae cyanobacterium CSU_3_4]
MPESADALLPQLAELWDQTLAWSPNERQQEQFEQLYRQVVRGECSA